MTIQQLEYIVAVNRSRHFVSASEQCGVRQPTLSQMIQKLENELGVKIFDRSKHPVEPTAMGLRLINQAEKALRELKKINELVLSETESLSGPLKIGVIPTLAPYLIPDFVHEFSAHYKSIDLTILELPTASQIEALRKEEIDMFIAATPLEQGDFFEIPLYYERFVAYFSANHPFRDSQLSADTMPNENLWVLHEGHCIRDQVFNFCQKSMSYNQSFEAGSIDTLIRIVDKNGGYSVIPEMHCKFLSEGQNRNVRAIDKPPAVREISVVIKNDFIKERIINAVADSIKKIIPENMLDERLKKFSIWL